MDRHELVRLDTTLGLPAIPPSIVEANPFVVADRLGQGRQGLRVDRHPSPNERDDGTLQHGDPTPDPGRQHLLQLGQGPQ